MAGTCRETLENVNAEEKTVALEKAGQDVVPQTDEAPKEKEGDAANEAEEKEKEEEDKVH